MAGRDDNWADAVQSEPGAFRCAVCLEAIEPEGDSCPECGESFGDGAASVWPPSVGELPGGGGWWRMHWRPVVMLGVIGAVLATGVTLRHLAPGRYQPPQKMDAPAGPVEPACDSPCWNGEACQLGQCVWQPPNDLGHLPDDPTVAGPFPLPPDVVDVLALDAERYAVSHLVGVQVVNARTGGVLTLVNDAPLAQRLLRVGDVVYATAPGRIFVIAADSMRVLKTIELGSTPAALAVGASAQLVIASLPGVHAAAVIATEYHAEVSRFTFAEDEIRPVAIDDTGERAFATNGDRPLSGLRPSLQSTRYGAIYPFDPRRLPSAQDRVRTGMSGNPVDVLMVPDQKTSFVALRERNCLVPLEHLESGTVRQGPPLPTCQGPEQIELVRQGRRAVVRCDAGRMVQVVGLGSRRTLRQVPLNARVSDMAVSPDARQAVLVMPREGGGAVALLDLQSYELRVHELRGEVHRIRLAPDGRSAVVISDSAKAAWILR